MKDPLKYYIDEGFVAFFAFHDGGEHGAFRRMHPVLEPHFYIDYDQYTSERYYIVDGIKYKANETFYLEYAEKFFDSRLECIELAASRCPVQAIAIEYENN